MPAKTRSQTGSLPQPITSSAEPNTLEAIDRGRRIRTEESVSFLTNDTTWAKRKAVPNPPLELPVFVIDLNLPPEERYVEVCAAYKEEIANLPGLFDDIVAGMVRVVPSWLVHWLAWLFLRGLYDKEETAELQGISRATGVQMYLLVCLNVLLDLFMGCSSGGAAVQDDSGQGSKMVHFRTLDWGMPSLRRILVQLDFKFGPDSNIVASSITYVGFTGVLTGVRKDFSLSLNFRGLHNDMDKFMSNVKYYGHYLMVLLGLRPSISSVLRSYLLGPSPNERREHRAAHTLPTYAEVVESASCRIIALTSSACYLCFSSGDETTVIEKDRVTARTSSNESFIVVTNSDNDVAARPSKETPVSRGMPTSPVSDKHRKLGGGIAGSFTADLAEIIEEANDRKQCAQHNYRKLLHDSRTPRLEFPPGQNMWATTLPKVDDIVELVQKYPTTNECTHFAAVMDSKEGKVAWSRYWMRPVGAKWIREHGGVD